MFNLYAKTGGGKGSGSFVFEKRGKSTRERGNPSYLPL